MPQLTVRAPAKVNLCLEVLGRRTDGHHEVRTVLQAVDLADRLTIEPAGTLTLRWDPASPVSSTQVTQEENLAMRAARLLQETIGTDKGARIYLHKVIPVAAGLGGGSSDAAAVLLGLRQAWELDIPDHHLLEIAPRLGSDVPFFLRGGAALGSGRGDRIQSLPPPLEEWAVISVPQGPPQTHKTARLYGLLTPAHYAPRPDRSDELVRRLHARQPLSGALYNVFEAVAPSVYPEYASHRAAFAAGGAHAPLLAGAGPSLFSLANDEAAASSLKDQLRGLGYEAYSARLLPAWGPEGMPG